MLRFELPIVEAGISLEEALAETIEARTRGLLCRAGWGQYRLVDFDSMKDAYDLGYRRVDDLNSEIVIGIESTPERNYEPLVRDAGRRFGFMGEADGRAHVFSLSESYARPLMTASFGMRCRRANKPASTPPRKWYHYYPPRTLDPLDPNRCRFCGFPVP